MPTAAHTVRARPRPAARRARSSGRIDSRALTREARRAGLVTSYVDGLGRARRTPAPAIRALLDLLGAARGSDPLGPGPRPRTPEVTRGDHRPTSDPARTHGPVPPLVVFLPLYAAWNPPRSASNGDAALARPIGDFTDLRALARWASSVSGALVGTLPLFPAFLGGPSASRSPGAPFDPSPYAPVTRLFWGEHWIDPAAAPEFDSPPARRVRTDSAFQSAARRAAAATLVDYRATWRIKRALLSAMAEAAYQDPARQRILERFERSDPLAAEYAEFRAAMDWRGLGPRRWRAAPVAYDDADRRLYLYAQFLAEEQMSRIDGPDRPLYLDLPVGVHADGFDAWRYPDLFLRGVSAGAPPDALHERGQVWGFPPMHPSAGRRDNYAYLRRVLRRLFSAARVVRIDHVMGLHRMYCVPAGFAPDQGAYLTYPAPDLYQVVRSEAARAGGIIVGEDLGTVPDAVRRSMRRAGLLGMHVQQFAFGMDRARGVATIGRPRRDQLACLNTHDTPTWAGFWHGDDIRVRERLGMLTAPEARRESAGRAVLIRALSAELRTRGLPASTPAAACRTMLRSHAASPASIQLVNLEDLWGERRPQNIPGTSSEHPNWRRRARRSLPQITWDPRIRDVLRALAGARATARQRSKGTAR